MKSDTTIISTANTQFLDIPFKHSVCPNFFPEEIGKHILSWLEIDGVWKRRIEEFYEAYDLDLNNTPFNGDVAFLQENDFTNTLKSYMENLYHTEFTDKVSLQIACLMPNNRIEIHSDFGPFKQTHRLLIQLNRNWSVENGGLFMLFKNPNAEELSEEDCYYLPTNLTAFTFQITPHSYHAVSKILEGKRYTLAYSFHSVAGYSEFPEYEKLLSEIKAA